MTIASRYRRSTVSSLVSRALPAPPALGDNDLPELENLVAVERLAAENHLEAVELGRIVRAGDLQPAVGRRAR